MCVLPDLCAEAVANSTPHLTAHPKESTAYCFVVYRSPVDTARMAIGWSPDPRSAIEVLSVTDLSEWKVCDTSVLLPYESGGNEDNAGIALKFHSGGTTLGKFAARRGFKGMPTTYLRRLARFVGVPLPSGFRAWSEPVLVDTLVRHFLGAAATDAIVEDALQRRKDTLHLDDVLKQSKVFDLEPDWVVNAEDDDPELVQAYMKLRAQQAAAEAKAKQYSEAMETMKQARGQGNRSAHADGPDAKPQGRKFVPVPATGYNPTEALKWAPPGCSISKDTKRENRWRVRAKYLPGGHEKTKSYGKNSSTDDYGAMRFLLEFCWQHYKRISGQECPFDFGDAAPNTSGAASSSQR